ncbi:hypothetical protein BCR44DRAFT_1432717 [Catenaria anguillulae PL171]|uniref:Uncharacterized protein n=1 Tax=Catenaria anguillulae PL171 TaxID=765915 RepID=A0A1Y2HPE1_9FUNG|nr:hypothetical protein BCR44DRAFT_1432717 [Catenaria anguillulae PL171]
MGVSTPLLPPLSANCGAELVIVVFAFVCCTTTILRISFARRARYALCSLATTPTSSSSGSNFSMACSISSKCSLALASNRKSHQYRSTQCLSTATTRRRTTGRHMATNLSSSSPAPDGATQYMRANSLSSTAGAGATWRYPMRKVSTYFGS